MLTIPMCTFCRHRPVRTDKPLTCHAFPDGIPREILELQLDHRLPLLDDHGVLFEPIDAEAAQAVVARWGSPQPK